MDDVIWGVLDPLGGQAHDMARTAWLAAGLPEHMPGVTIDRQWGSSQQTVHFGAQGVMAGVQDLVLTGGIQRMSCVPTNSSVLQARELGFPISMRDARAGRRATAIRRSASSTVPS